MSQVCRECPVLGTLAPLLGLFQPGYLYELREACCIYLVRQLQMCRLLWFQSVLLKDLQKAIPKPLFLWLLLGGYIIADRPTLHSSHPWLLQILHGVYVWLCIDFGHAGDRTQTLLCIRHERYHWATTCHSRPATPLMVSHSHLKLMQH